MFYKVNNKQYSIGGKIVDKQLKLTIDGKQYTAKLNNNQTVEDIIKMLPLRLTLQRYAAHEYYGRLAQKPSIKGVPSTSDVYAGGLYYFDGWGAFSVLYGDAHIAPFEVVHIGNVIEMVKEFLFQTLELQSTFTEIGIDDNNFEIMAKKAVTSGGLGFAFKPLSEEDVVNIFKMCK